MSSSWPRPASNCSIPLIRQLRLTSRAVTGADREQDSGRNSCVYILADARCSNTVNSDRLRFTGSGFWSANIRFAIAAVYPDRNKWKCIIGIEKRCEYQCGLLPPIYRVLWICSTWFVWPCSGVFPPLKWHTDPICGTNMWAGSPVHRFGYCQIGSRPGE